MVCGAQPSPIALVGGLGPDVAVELEDLVGVEAARMDQAEAHLLAGAGGEDRHVPLVAVDRAAGRTGAFRLSAVEQHCAVFEKRHETSPVVSFGQAMPLKLGCIVLKLTAVEARGAEPDDRGRRRRGRIRQAVLRGEHELVEGGAVPRLHARLDAVRRLPAGRPLGLDHQRAEQAVLVVVDDVGRQQVGDAELDRDVGVDGIAHVDVAGVPGVGHVVADRPRRLAPGWRRR